MRLLVILGVLALAGCATDNLTGAADQAIAECHAAHGPATTAAYETCVKQRYSYLDMHPEFVSHHYRASGGSGSGGIDPGLAAAAFLIGLAHPAFGPAPFVDVSTICTPAGRQTICNSVAQ